MGISVVCLQRPLRSGASLCVCLILGALLQAGSASATPVTFNFTSGMATVTATTGPGNGVVVMSSTVIPLNGVSVTFDESTIDLVDLFLTIPPSAIIATSNPYGGYDAFSIESADLSPGVGYSTLFGQSLGGGDYAFAAGPLDINGVYSATDSTFTNPDLLNAAIPFTDDSLISGSINVNTGTLTMSGITLATLLGVDFGEAHDLSIKADIVFVGAVPEPSTAALVGLGLAVLTARCRRRGWVA